MIRIFKWFLHRALRDPQIQKEVGDALTKSIQSGRTSGKRLLNAAGIR